MQTAQRQQSIIPIVLSALTKEDAVRLTTVRVRKARQKTLKELVPHVAGKELVEVTAYGQTAGIVDLATGQVVYLAEGLDGSGDLPVQIVNLAVAALPVMAAGLEAFASSVDNDQS